MSDTQRTDALLKDSNERAISSVQLCKELTELTIELEHENAELEKKLGELEWVLHLINAGRTKDFKYVCDHTPVCLCWDCQVIRIAAAIESEGGTKVMDESTAVDPELIIENQRNSYEKLAHAFSDLQRENAELSKLVSHHKSTTEQLIQALELASTVTYLPEVRARIARVIEIMEDRSHVDGR